MPGIVIKVATTWLPLFWASQLDMTVEAKRDLLLWYFVFFWGGRTPFQTLPSQQIAPGLLG